MVFNSRLVPKPLGKINRKELNTVFKGYINAYVETANEVGFMTPTIMFVFSEKGGDKQRVLFPYTLPSYTEKTLVEITRALLFRCPPSTHSLEMVMYTRFNPNFKELETHDIMFSGRDMAGSVIHSVFRCTKVNQQKANIQGRELKGMNTWIPQDTSVDTPFPRINDAFLDQITAVYSLSVSMEEYESLEEQDHQTYRYKWGINGDN